MRLFFTLNSAVFVSGSAIILFVPSCRAPYGYVTALQLAIN